MSYSLSSQPCINLLYITGCDPAAKLDKAVKELARRMDEIEYANTETNEICEGYCGKYEGGRKGGATIPMVVANIVIMLAPRTLFPHFMYTWTEAYKA